MNIDSSDLYRLTDDLRVDRQQLLAEVQQVVSRGALNVKRDWQRTWTGLGNAPALASAVTYDMKTRGSSVEAEVGPDKNRRQGALGNIIEFGTAKNPPRPGGGPALAREAPRLENAIQRLADGLLR